MVKYVYYNISERFGGNRKDGTISTNISRKTENRKTYIHIVFTNINGVCIN